MFIYTFDHKYLGNHLLKLCPKIVKHPEYQVMTVVSCVLFGAGKFWAVHQILDEKSDEITHQCYQARASSVGSLCLRS